MNQSLDQFRQSFLEEAQEILADVESSLFELNLHPGDKDLLNRVFRSMHTLKGSGAMFGFDDMADFTHNLENAFDVIRNGRLPFSEDLVDLALRSLDHVRALLRGEPGDQKFANQILQELCQFVDPGHSVRNHHPDLIAQASISGSNHGEEIDWSIQFTPHAETRASS
jgi:two-component system chemotaxis sensor kinase CheA